MLHSSYVMHFKDSFLKNYLVIKSSSCDVSRFDFKSCQDSKLNEFKKIYGKLKITWHLKKENRGHIRIGMLLA